MSVPEVGHRLVEKVLKVLGRKFISGWSKFSVNDIHLPVIPGFSRSIDSAPASLQEEAECAAKQIMAHRFKALGVAWPHFTFIAGPKSPWHLDPVTGKYWPAERYCFDIKYRGSTEMGDVKYVWEFSRLQFLQPVALHARLSNNEDAVKFITEVIASWYASNPPFKGVGWSSGIELSLRTISLLIVTSLIGDRLDMRTRILINEILLSHAFWLERYPSRFSSSNNHLVSEQAALYLIGVTCPFVPGAARLVKRAEAALVREASLQIHADGVAAEQSPTYGALTSELLLLCAWVADQRGSPMTDGTRARLAAFAEWINWLAEPDGTVPAIGDDDEGRVLTLGQEEPSYASSVAAAVASFAERSDLVPPHVQTFRNALVAPSSPASRPFGTRSFPDGGYTVHRTMHAGHQISLVVDHGPLGYLAIAAHGHADALSFTLSIDGQPVFVDPGTYLYHSGHQWRDWFRNTRAHNTLSVEGTEQSIVSGAFNWANKAQTRLEQVNDAPFKLQASHDGYCKRFGVRHRRSVMLADGELTLMDMLVGGPERTAEIVLQLAPECEVVNEGPEIVVLRGASRLVRIAFPPRGSINQTRGAVSTTGGWISPHFGAKFPATRLAWSGRVGAEGVTTRITLC
ncbi:heparinase II/III family protein [Sphingomonas sp. RHCKR47]|nr:heparinase II/III family protein [Sphingomonas citricola]